jgi:hypothetical protein
LLAGAVSSNGFAASAAGGFQTGSAEDRALREAGSRHTNITCGCGDGGAYNFVWEDSAKGNLNI